jgi:hypothetical protein
MEIPIKIEVSDEDCNTCGGNCPFKIAGRCTLFNSDLGDTELPTGYEWNDRAPTKERCYHCYSIT